ncbi:hypothetical protein [Dysgonomonas termitidis]|uniref:Uncharacterized protein n=1 Tax=Dysgonomonas termitidis TaxID=1516126 RepID=A0ABV9KPJ5_9BACT
MKYVNRKAAARRHMLLSRFLMIIGFVFIALTVYGAVSEPDNALYNILIGSGTGTYAMCAMVSINDVPDREVAGSAIGDKIYPIPVQDIDDSVPFPTVNANREVTTIPMLPGKFMHAFDTHSVPTFLSSGTKDAGAIVANGTNTFTAVMGGTRDELKNFVEDYFGLKFVIIFKHCESGNMYGIGNACKGVVFSGYEYKDDADGQYLTMTFTQITIQLPWTYIGAIVQQNPATNAADSTTLAVVAGNNRYIIPDGTAATYAINAVSGITAADVGRVITLIGDGETYAATVPDGGPFLLVDGATWTASKGSQLNLKVFDANTLIEVNRI